jgi:2-methylisocitrate lyase-like PEP mutase family enzyme
MTGLRDLIDRATAPVVAPLVINPLSALLARDAGFPALYLGGGAMGYVKAVTEANLALPEMVQAGIDIRTVCPLPLILDGACGWGDAMHQRRTIGMSEAAGFAAIEIEDQILPKRAHHHIGIEHVIDADQMAAKIAEAVASRRSKEFLIIARSNAARMLGLDEALRRGEAYRRAGADILFVLPKTPEEARTIGERLPGPLMFMASGGLAAMRITPAELFGLGYRLLVDPTTPLMAAYRAMRDAYAAMAAGRPDPLLGAAGTRPVQAMVHETIGLEALLEIERRTVERTVEGEQRG